MLKSEASDVARLPLPFKKILPFVGELTSAYEASCARSPASTLKEISSFEHKVIDEVVLRALSLSEYGNAITGALRDAIVYREDKSKS